MCVLILVPLSDGCSFYVSDQPRCNLLFIVGSDLGSTMSGIFYGVIGSFYGLLLGVLCAMLVQWRMGSSRKQIASCKTTGKLTLVSLI